MSKGISTAIGQKTPTGRINAMFNEDTGFIRKMVGKVVPIAVAVATKSPVASALSGSAVAQFMSQSTNGAKFAADLMGSPQFQVMIRQAVKEGVVEGSKASKKLIDAENKLSKSKVYQKWAEKIITDDRGALTGGVLGYLFGSQSNKEDTKEQKQK